MSDQRFFLKTDWSGYTEVDQETWVRAERGAGFWPNGTDRGQPATGGFSNGSVQGTAVYWPMKDTVLEAWRVHGPEVYEMLLKDSPI